MRKNLKYRLEIAINAHLPLPQASAPPPQAAPFSPATTQYTPFLHNIRFFTSSSLPGCLPIFRQPPLPHRRRKTESFGAHKAVSIIRCRINRLHPRHSPSLPTVCRYSALPHSAPPVIADQTADRLPSCRSPCTLWTRSTARPCRYTTPRAPRPCPPLMLSACAAWC